MILRNYIVQYSVLFGTIFLFILVEINKLYALFVIGRNYGHLILYFICTSQWYYSVLFYILILGYRTLTLWITNATQGMTYIQTAESSGISWRNSVYQNNDASWGYHRTLKKYRLGKTVCLYRCTKVNWQCVHNWYRSSTCWNNR